MAAANWIKAWKREVGSGRPKKPVRRLRLGVEALENRTNPTTFTWNHGGADGNWSTAANWVGGVAPTAADTDAIIVFNTVDPNSVMDIVGMNVAEIDFDAGSDISLTLNTNLILDGAGAAINIEDDSPSTNSIAGPGSLVLTNANAVIEHDSFPGFLQISAPFSGNEGFTKTGIGTLILSTTAGEHLHRDNDGRRRRPGVADGHARPGAVEQHRRWGRGWRGRLSHTPTRTDRQLRTPDHHDTDHQRRWSRDSADRSHR